MELEFSRFLPNMLSPPAYVLRVSASMSFGTVETEREQKFDALAERWREERGPTSSATRMAMTPSYQQIIGMGEDAVPLILGELMRKPDHWFWALKAITGEDPVSPQSRGNLKEMAFAWVLWGLRRRRIVPL